MARKSQSRPERQRSRSTPPATAYRSRRRMANDAYTAEEVADKLGIHRAAVYAGAKDGRIPSIRVSPKRVIFPKAAIDGWLESAGKPSAAA